LGVEFVRATDLFHFEPGDRCIFLKGEALCRGSIRIEVEKRIQFLTDSSDPLVKTDQYRYNVSVNGVGVIFRYEGPHITHNREHWQAVLR
jgi:hypothetical protein